MPNGQHPGLPQQTTALGLIIYGVVLLSIVVASTVLGLKHVIQGDALIGLFGTVATGATGATAYHVASRRTGRRSTDLPPPANGQN